MRCFDFFDRYTNLQFLLGAAMFLAVYSLAISIVINTFFNPDILTNPYVDDIGSGEFFFWVVLAGPLVETFFIQYLIIEVIFYLSSKLNIPNRTFIAVTVSSVLFGLSHSFGFFYAIISFIAGVLLALIYIVAKERKGLNSFFAVFFVHAFNNLICLFYEYLTS